MLVYRHQEQTATPLPRIIRCRDRLEQLSQTHRPGHDDAVDVLVDLGETEAAITDALCPLQDARSPLTDALRQASLGVGHLVSATAHGEHTHARQAAAVALARLDALAAMPLPATVALRVSEGYAYYALYPETYLKAAEEFARQVRPEAAVCIGIRSIGTSLSAVVGATLESMGCAVTMLTLRPRGHPYDRRPVTAPALQSELRRHSGGFFLIVDEGPGLSGSSFCGTAALLSELGVPDDRIVLFPSWETDGTALISALARARWPRHRRCHVAFEAVRPPAAGMIDLSAGAWRAHVYTETSAWPVVQPQHERRKLLDPVAGRLSRFAGLGHYGTARRHRAEQLAEAGFAPAVHGLEAGFLITDFVPGQPVGADKPADGELIGTAARYIAHLHRHCALDQPADRTSLTELVRVNVAKALGQSWLDRLPDLEALAGRLDETPAVALDGRMLPHEWLHTPTGYVKCDGIDHHDDHFFPGPTDIAWDIAGFAVEFALSDRNADAFAGRVAGLTGDRTLPTRLPFHRLAYLAFRLGYTMLAARTLGQSRDGIGMAAQARSYRRLLRNAISAMAS